MIEYSIDLVMVNYNTADLIKESIPQLLEKTDFPDFKLTVVDNASPDNSYDVIAEMNARYPDRMDGIKLTRNFGYGVGCNYGAKLGESPIVMFLNSDVFPAPDCPDWITPLIEAFQEDKKIAIAGPKLVGPNGEIMGACVYGTNSEPRMDHYWKQPDDGRFDEPEDCLTICGAAFAVRRSLFEKWGGFDPAYFLYYEETDLAYKARWEGYKVRYVPDSKLLHLHQQTEGREHVLSHYVQRSKEYFDQKWQQFLPDGRSYGKVVK